MSPTSQRKLHCALFASTFLAACGGRALDTPEALPIRTYPSDTEFTMSFVMRSCSDSCSTYEPGECDAVLGEGNVIEVEVRVSYAERDGLSAEEAGICHRTCGPQVFAH